VLDCRKNGAEAGGVGLQALWGGASGVGLQAAQVRAARMLVVHKYDQGGKHNRLFDFL